MYEEQTQAKRQECPAADQNQAVFALPSARVWQERQITEEHVPGLSMNRDRRRFRRDAV